MFAHGPSVSSFYITRWNGATALLDLNGYSQILPALSWAGNGAATARVIDTLASGKTVALTHTVGEAREIRELARKNPGIITHSGNHGTSSVTQRCGIDLLFLGALGQVSEVIVSMDYAGNF